MKVYVISYCVKKGQGFDQLNFTGHFLGKKIKAIRVIGSELELGEEYVLKLDTKEVVSSTLYCELIKFKKLFN